MKLKQRCYVHLLFSGQGLWHDGHDTQTVSDSHVTVMIYIIKGIGIRFIVLYPPKCSHNLPSLAGLYTRTPFQSRTGLDILENGIKKVNSK